jgi:hypothetical protein
VAEEVPLVLLLHPDLALLCTIQIDAVSTECVILFN